MDYELNIGQQETLGAVDTLLRRCAGRERGRAMRDTHDDELLETLRNGGFLSLATHPDAGPLDAALVVEVAARELGAATVAATGLVAPMVLGATPPGRVALATVDQEGPVRFGADADLVLVLDGDDVRLLEPGPDATERVATGYVAPYGWLPHGHGKLLQGAGRALARWWRIALAVEISGLLSAALDLTVSYLAERKQFGKPIGGLQAIQHRLAECYVSVEGTRWIARSAAWHGDDESSATAATYATMVSRDVATDLHQLSGAIGFTEEYDLHLWTMKAQALRAEFGGIGAHAAAVSEYRWAC